MLIILTNVLQGEAVAEGGCGIEYGAMLHQPGKTAKWILRKQVN